MKKRRQAELSGVQQEIIALRDTDKLSWGQIDARLNLSKGSAATYYRRGKRVLATREAAQRDWERNESRRFTENAWWRLSKSARKRYAARAPYPPEVMATLRKPKRSRDDRAWNRADNPLLTETPSTPLPQPAIAPEPSQCVPEPTQRISAAPVPSPSRYSKMAFDWNERAGGEPIFRDRDGNVVDCVLGTGPRKDRWFLRDSNEVDEVLIFRVFCRGDVWLIRDPRDGTERLIQVENAHTYESQSRYDCLYRPNRPRVSWLRITGVALEPLLQAGLTPKSTINNDALAERERIRREGERMSVSRSAFVQEVDTERQEKRRAEKPSVDLTDPATVEDLYFNGPGFVKPKE